MPPMDLFSGIVVIGVLIIAVAIYIFCIIAWYAYRQHVLSVGEGNGNLEEAKMEKYFPSMRWKPFLNTFNILKKENGNGNYADDDLEENSGGSTVCVVCLRVFEDGELVRQFPQCHHTFHADCIDKWLYSHSECCPLCRCPVNPQASYSRCGGETTPGNNSHEVSVDIGTSTRAISTS
ncbi:hypothetical protein FEM48_Zijuj01G0271300 [Ziziphus jujuba var. spinosa]|uniref:RING-type domain-containing protein n=1 Tax=Ziziphus jujuba var. spinosa TaxID=714518 RepID=A0A978W567_ZIZJJ|nr:hypothetical protein FEM48_Zijuj01G0271300 [Ziziphus jujuba var. spinosa]